MVPQVQESSLTLYPWKDGIHASKKLLGRYSAPNANTAIKSIRVIFEEKTYQCALKDSEIIDLFEHIGNDFSKLESVKIQVSVSRQFTLPTVATPPVAALTSLLAGSNNRIQSLALEGLRLLGDDFDIFGLAEALRIHPTLCRFVMKKCRLAEELHLETLKKAIQDRSNPTMKHCDWNSNVIVDDESNDYPLLSGANYHVEDSERSYEAHCWDTMPTLSWWSYPISCCI